MKLSLLSLQTVRHLLVTHRPRHVLLLKFCTILHCILSALLKVKFAVAQSLKEVSIVCVGWWLMCAPAQIITGSVRHLAANLNICSGPS
ncbi:hypothetical protein F4779DRAFT_607179 [Xylariaceae sp. FL0662B]|nr:hypothetical protein F4779DRAFT_607179 [Xylariaceae sp. FL0662B]